MTTLLVVFCASSVACLSLTPLVRALARRFDLVDRPDGGRKIHGREVPLGGGVAILLSSHLAIFAAIGFSPLRNLLVEASTWLVGLCLATVMIAVIGLVDDYRALRGRHKLILQMVAISLVMSCGVVVRSISLFEWQLDLGLLALPFTFFLLLGAINSLNLLDGMDGLLSSVGFIICLAMAALAVMSGNWATASIAVAVAGALLGFLRFNFPPATIFMGDCGSMQVGLVIGVLAIQSSLKGPATVALAAPLAVLTLPIFDTFAAIVRRKLTGRSLYAPDRGHLHHCLLHRGLSVRRVLSLVSFLGLITLVGAFASVTLKNELVAVISAMTVVGILIVTRLFGHAEFVLIRDRLRASMAHWLGGPPSDTTGQFQARLQGSADWSALWQELLGWSEPLNLSMICLNVNAPAFHENFHARWDRGTPDPADGDGWRVQLPLTCDGQRLGSLEIAGRLDREASCSKMALLAQLIEDLESSPYLEIAVARSSAAPGRDVDGSPSVEVGPSVEVAAGALAAGVATRSVSLPQRSLQLNGTRPHLASERESTATLLKKPR